MSAPPKAIVQNQTRTRWQLLLAAVSAGALLWVFWPTLVELASRWGSESQYSHGFVVPAFACFLLWARRRLVPAEPLQPSWWGLVLLAAGLAVRFAGTYLFFSWFGAVSLLLCLAGLCLVTGGWKALAWAWPAIAFLAFMVPLPYRLEGALAHPLQRVATLASTYTLQTLGFPAFAEGNVIHIGEIRIGVVEACSGLSMLLIFFALSTAVTLLSKRPPLERAVIFLTAIPIAILANITRIVITAIMHRTVGHELADYVFHDLAGLLMPVLGLMMLWAVVTLLDWVLVVPIRSEPAPFELASFGLGGRRPARKTENAETKAKVASPQAPLP